MIPYFATDFGNPSAGHSYGFRAKQALESARKQVSGMINATPEEVLFTSGSTESLHTAINGAINRWYHLKRAKRILLNENIKCPTVISSRVEHHAVVDLLEALRDDGRIDLVLAKVGNDGRVNPDDVSSAVSQCQMNSIALISIIHAQNETGVINDIREISLNARNCQEFGIALIHTDASQSIGKIPVTVDLLQVDLLTVAGHKMYGPKGVGALYIKNGVDSDSGWDAAMQSSCSRPISYFKIYYGAPQENRRRSGTENVPLIVGLGVAATEVKISLAQYAPSMQKCRDLLEKLLLSAFQSGEVIVNGNVKHRLPNTLSIGFRYALASNLVNLLKEKVACTAGAACSFTSQTNNKKCPAQVQLPSISPILSAMGVPPSIGGGTLRLSLGRDTTEEQVRQAAKFIVEAVKLDIDENTRNGTIEQWRNSADYH